LFGLQRQALRYFLDNQAANGMVLDRQRNHGPPCGRGLCSTAATGMGCIALALAAAPPYHLLTRQEAVVRVRASLLAVGQRLPHEHGMVPHFIDAQTGLVYGTDYFSTVDTAWLLAGALWAAAFLRDGVLEKAAAHLYERVDWVYWTAPGKSGCPGLLRHGQGRDGRFLGCSWDRLNGETAFLYVLAAGAAEPKALSAASWAALQPFYGTVAGLRFNNADLGLFVFQYGFDLLDLYRWRVPHGINLMAEARLATLANYRACREASDTFLTYRHYWGVSAGDGPAGPPAGEYRCYAPAGLMDGTAHLTATLAAAAHCPDLVLENLRAARRERHLRPLGRYGFSNVNLDRGWFARDMVAIDAGAAVLALDNYLVQDRVRGVFQTIPQVRRGMWRCGFLPADGVRILERRPLKRAS
jgi:hypothetical protein